MKNKPLVLSINRLSATVFVIILLSGSKDLAIADNCCGAAGGTAGLDLSQDVSVGAEMFGDAASCEINPDSNAVSIRTIGYFGYSLSADGHRGDPLGTGGKQPLLMLTSLYKENNNELPALSRRDLRIQYGDFGYLPLWKNNVLLTRVDIAINNQFMGAATVAYGGELGQPGTAQAAGAFGIGEVSLTWKPSVMKGFSLTGGNILDHGNFCPLYNQTLIENFIYTGTRLSYTTEFGEDLVGGVVISGGGIINNHVALQDQSTKSISPSSYYKATRNRTFANARIGLGVQNRISMKFSGGLQNLPADTMETVSELESSVREYRGGIGWFGGVESALHLSSLHQNIFFLFAHGDVITGAGSPDYVRYNTASAATNETETEWFSRQNSSLKALAYWASWRGLKRFEISAGGWATRRDPDPNPIAELNRNRPYTPDSVLQSYGLSTDSILILQAEPSMAFKGAVAAAVKIAGPLSVSLRTDRIQYLTPDAHLNGQEPLRDRTIRPAANYPIELYDQALYEREAVNAWILTPQVSLSFAEIGGFSFAFSHAWYEQQVDRQGRIADQHDNFTVSAFINHRFSVR